MTSPRPPFPLENLLAGDPLATARAISLVENQEPGARDLLRRIAPRTGRAHRIGVAGPPGAGKSTLIGALIQEFRRRGRSVGVLATDPSSTLTGGAILGDRVRIQEPGEDRGIFYRSMATRGYPGGLARACRDALRVLDASGKDILLVETVGVGQAEIDIAAIVDTLVLVLVPESGDFVQMLKAGLLEFGDVLVVNKADRAGADDVAEDLKEMLTLRPARDGWTPPVLKASAREGTGVPEVAAAVERHRAFLASSGRLAARRRDQAAAELRERLLDAARGKIEARLTRPDALQWIRRLGEGRAEASSAAEALQKRKDDGVRQKR